MSPHVLGIEPPRADDPEPKETEAKDFDGLFDDSDNDVDDDNDVVPPQAMAPLVPLLLHMSR